MVNIFAVATAGVSPQGLTLRLTCQPLVLKRRDVYVPESPTTCCTRLTARSSEIRCVLARASVNKLLAQVVNRLTDPDAPIFLVSTIITTVCNEYSTQAAALFYTLRPIIVNAHYTKWISDDWKGLAGISGCPIFNSKCKLVSHYVLGHIESNAIIVSQALTVLVSDIRPKVVPETYFKSAVIELMNQKSEDGQT